MEEAAADRRRRSRRDDEAQSGPPRPAGVMGVAKNTTPQQQRTRPSPATDFSVDDDSSLRPTGWRWQSQPIRGKESPIKAEEKETREERTVADHGQREVSAQEALRPPVNGSRP